MRQSKVVVQSSDSALLVVVVVVLAGLKLQGVIDWSWWLITAPLWFGLAIVALIVAIWGLGALLMIGSAYAKNRFYKTAYGRSLLKQRHERRMARLRG